MKFKLFNDIATQKLIDVVNEFIKDKHVVDYKFSSEYVPTQYNSAGIPIKGSFYVSILIGYEDNDEGDTVLK